MNREQLEEIRSNVARLEQLLGRSGDDPAAIRARSLKAAQDVPALLDEIARRDAVVEAALAWHRSIADDPATWADNADLALIAAVEDFQASGAFAARQARLAAEGSAEGGTSKGSEVS